MQNRHRRAHLRRVVATVGVGGAAVMASTFMLAPAAMADDVVDPGTTTEPTAPPAEDPPRPADTPTPPDSTEDPTGTDEPTDPPAEAETPAKKAKKSSASTEAAAAALAPDFGYNKFRVGVQIDDGSWVAPGTTTLGSEITLVETGPGVPGGTQTQTCTTTVVDPVVPTTTYCAPLGSPPFEHPYEAEFGDSVTITQTTVNDGLVIVDGTMVNTPECGGLGCSVTEGDILLTDSGPPPEASDDDPCADPGTPVDVDVLANDDTHGAPLTDLAITADPSKGSATVIGAGDDRTVTYTPDDDFSGTDSFDYRITTANGTATATVVFTACPQPTEPLPDTGDTPETRVLPDTGGGDPRVLGYGLALVLGGSALITAGTRRRREPSVID
jgi:hypothetical protein